MRTITTTINAALLTVALCAGAYAADPLIKLSDAELDSVAAGYLTVEVYAAAEAFGPVTEAMSTDI